MFGVLELVSLIWLGETKPTGWRGQLRRFVVNYSRGIVCAGYEWMLDHAAFRAVELIHRIRCVARRHGRNLMRYRRTVPQIPRRLENDKFIWSFLKDSLNLRTGKPRRIKPEPRRAVLHMHKKKNRKKVVTIDRFIKDTEYAGIEYVGRFHLYVGVRPVPDNEPDLVAADKLMECGAPAKIVTKVLGTYRSPGGWDFNKERLRELAEVKPIPKLSIGLLDMACRYLDELPLKVIRYVGRPALRKVGLNPLAYSGFYGRRDFHHIKMTAQMLSIEVVERCYDIIVEHGRLSTALFEIGGREKVVQVGKPSRMILMDDLVPTIIGTMIARPILDMFMASKTSPIYVGSSWTKCGFWRFLDDINHDVTVENDWSKYDFSVPEIVLRQAFAVIESCYYSKTPDEARALRNIMDYLYGHFVNSLIVCPGGFVYRKRRGIPSGSPFTSLIGSIANWLIHRALLSAVFPAGREVGCAGHPRLVIAGDDSVMSGPYSMEDGMVHAYLVADRLFGLTVKNGEPKVTYKSERYMGDAPSFLGYTFINNFPERTDEELIEKIIHFDYQRGRVITPFQRRMRAQTVIQMGPLLTMGRDWLRRYARWVTKASGVNETEIDTHFEYWCEQAFDLYLNPHSLVVPYVPLKDKIRKGRNKWEPPMWLEKPTAPSDEICSHYVYMPDVEVGMSYNTWDIVRSIFQDTGACVYTGRGRCTYIL